MASFFPSSGPTLPDFRTLLVKGNYHASAPIHLSLSYVHAHDAAKVLLISPSRARFMTEMKQLRDSWTNEHGGDGQVARAANRIELLLSPFIICGDLVN